MYHGRSVGRLGVLFCYSAFPFCSYSIETLHRCICAETRNSVALLAMQRQRGGNEEDTTPLLSRNQEFGGNSLRQPFVSAAAFSHVAGRARGGVPLSRLVVDRFSPAQGVLPAVSLGF